MVTSDLGIIELTRAAWRVLGTVGLERAVSLVDELVLVPYDIALRSRAGALEPPELRTLDAIHLASALTLGEGIPFYCYDRRLSEAAAAAGLDVRSP